MRIVVVGARGQLGTDLMRVLEGEDVIPLSHQEIEVADFDSSLKVLKEYSPDVIINTAAYNRVDEAEDEPELAFEVNAFGPRNLALISKEVKTTLVHISTDYVFDGTKTSPYTESDPPNPLSAYGLSKLTGEYFVRSILSNYFIVRTSGLYGRAGSRAKGGNFVETMLRLARNHDEVRVVNDHVLTPTYSLDLARKIEELIQTELYGLYHITNSGSCSWYEFTKRIFELMNLKTKVVPISSPEFRARAVRPSYSVLENSRLKEIGLASLRSWQEALADYLKERDER